MGFLVDSREGSGRDGQSLRIGFKALIRRKQVDSAHSSTSSSSSSSRQHQLARELSISHLISIGVGATIGAGVYILVGTVAREHSGPALAISFLIAGIAAALSAFCYAELSSRCPSAGSAYHYAYICVGEGVAWLVGWALILEYTLGGSAVARGISPNLALMFGGNDRLPSFLARQTLPGLDIVVDPCAAILVLIVTALLCKGIKESIAAQAIVTAANICAMMFVIVAGSYLGFKTGWVGYRLPTGYFPYGVDGMLAGSATVFFAYIGFDAVASTAEEVKNPQRDLPVGIASSLSLCCALYMLVSIVIVGLVPYYEMDPDTPISSAFAQNGMQWAAYVVSAGAVTALCSTLLGSILPQPRILMAMARDGLLPSFFSDVSKNTQVPVKSTIASGVGAAILAFFMDVSELAGMVSVGTLLAFTTVAVSVLILRYIPPNEVPLPLSLQEPFDPLSLPCQMSADDTHEKSSEINSPKDSAKPLLDKVDSSIDIPTIGSYLTRYGCILNEKRRRKIAGWSILSTCVGALILTYAASNLSLPSYVRYSVCGTGVMLLLSALVVLSCIDQDDARHNFGHAGGFTCPFVPLLPIVCILINIYLLINLGVDTWARVSIWLAIGVIVYAVYGRTHSCLHDVIYVPAGHAEKVNKYSREVLA
ncbi:cationic amino acid transporter 2, vacuolar-like [Cucurbita pepo subsp. pepo]|uniref:cationic amino acid transporter 2, vacuolar-like n=1 Tax=Cucurbita pepo subsp. pepo TaxID=3664 RepID=UPI000C9D84B1|nr:cationic amino acid transporter 2, vacuolar-like [Cucurbita pepo subsp. pepo]XP_023543444.1 cationic amino acid transporter 2, vacuolar-like [Cucurbita pepo subsp. pepo]